MASALLLDTLSLFYRAHHALPPMNTSVGAPTSALYGFSALVLKLLRERRPTALAFARDTPQRTFRHERYAAYKATRAPMPEALRAQMDGLDRLIRAFGAPSLAASGFEADDVLASASRELADAGADITVVSGDRDLFQVIGPRVQVLFVGARARKPETMDAAAVQARYGVPADRLPSLFALLGEPSDNLIGVRGVGLRTAEKLVAEHGSVAAILSSLDRVTPVSLRSALGAAAERMRLNEELARLRSDLPLARPLATEVAPRSLDGVRTLFAEFEFKSLLPRLDALRESLCMP